MVIILSSDNNDGTVTAAAAAAAADDDNRHAKHKHLYCSCREAVRAAGNECGYEDRLIHRASFTCPYPAV